MVTNTLSPYFALGFLLMGPWTRETMLLRLCSCVLKSKLYFPDHLTSYMTGNKKWPLKYNSPATLVGVVPDAKPPRTRPPSSLRDQLLYLTLVPNSSSVLTILSPWVLIYCNKASCIVRIIECLAVSVRNKLLLKVANAGAYNSGEDMWCHYQQTDAGLNK